MQRLAIPLVLSCVWLVACGDDANADLKAQELTRVEQDDDLAECKNGGVTISTGVDTNKDGKLDEDEVTDTQVICSGDSVDPGEEGGEITRVDVLKEGDEMCPVGGVAVHRGIDDDNDGELADDEIDETEHLCSPEGEAPHGVLARTTALAVGSAECPWGGKLVESGIDDGAGAGEPDDGVLADEEVDTHYVSCDSSPPRTSEPTDPPAGPVGTATIDLRGGNSASGQAGYGGGINAGSYSACIPEITKFFATGLVDAPVTAPAVTINLGAEPYDVAADTALAALPGDVGTRVDGTRYLDSNSSVIVRWDGTALNTVEVTGLRVAAGVTLTLPVANTNLYFDQDVDIAGTVALADGASRRLALYGRTVQLGASSVIDATGSTGSVSTLEIGADGSLTALGQLIAAGSDTSTLAGGSISLYSSGRMYVGGTLDASGGDSAAASGAAGGNISLSGGSGGVWSSAVLKAFGGTGALLGGLGGNVTIGDTGSGGAPREVRNSGAVDVSGGAQTLAGCTGGPCTGGVGGNIAIISHSADLRSTGALKANGGSSHSVAGDGGQIAIGVQPLSEGTQIRSRLSLSGDVHAQGGEGFATAAAGDGGSVNYFNCGGNTSVSEWLGYQSLILSGGSSSTLAGDAGEFALSDSESASDVARRLYYHVPLTAKGGDGASGGQGGSFYAELSINAILKEELPPELPTLVLGGAHVLNGGNSTADEPGSGGYFAIASRGAITALGSLENNGGGGVAFGGQAGFVAWLSLVGTVQNHSTLSVNGGAASAGEGAQGGCIDLQGNTISNDAKLSARGGAGTTIGGDGGDISMTNIGGTGTNTGELDVAGGAGTAAGTSGLAGFGIGQCISKRG